MSLPQNIFSLIEELVMTTSLIALKSYAASENIELIKSITPRVGIVDYTSTLLLSGRSARFRIRVHYNDCDAVAWRPLQHDETPDQSLESTDAIAFFNEFSNLHAGMLSGLFDNAGVTLGASLPTCLRRVKIGAGIDKFERELNWILKTTSASLSLSCGFSISDVSVYERAESKLRAELVEAEKKSGTIQLFD